MNLPSSVEPTLPQVSSVFRPRVARRALVLMVGMILCRGRRTVTAALRGAGRLADGHFSSYHRIFGRASW